MSFDQTLPRTRGRRRPLSAIRLRRPRLRLLVAILLLAAVLGGGWMLLRDSSLVAVRTVRVVGVTSTAEPRIRDALEAAGTGMTTLHVREDELRRAVAGFPSVAGLRVRTDFPHGLTVEVLERHPVAVFATGDQLTAASGGGLLLRDVAAPDDVPEIAAPATPAGARVTDRKLLSALAVAGAAPVPLRKRTIRIEWGARGLTAELESGPPLIFGTADDAAAKWAGAARVLAEPSAAGATYLDLRVAGRVAAGGLGPVVPEDTATPPTGAISTVTPTPSPDPQP
jgi:cell division protein FtsQ